METTNLLVSVDTLQGAGAWGMYSLDLLLKSCFVLLGTMLAAYLLRKQAAVIRHLLWYTCLLILLCLPFLSVIIPPFWFNLPLGGDRMYAALSGWGPGWFWLLVLMVYALGVLLILFSLGRDIIRIYLLSHRARSPRPGVAEQIVAELEDKAGRTGKVQVRYSDEITGPLSWGILRPLILMPTEALSWPLEKNRLVIAHELGHIQRQDWLSLVVLRIVCALYWFNPLIWRAAQFLDTEAEKACDDVVVLEAEDQTHYARTLLEVARERVRQQERSMPAKAMAASFLSHRVMAILDGNTVRAQADFLYFFRAALVAAVVSVLLAGTGLSAVEGLGQDDRPPQPRLFNVEYIPHTTTGE